MTTSRFISPLSFQNYLSMLWNKKSCHMTALRSNLTSYGLHNISHWPNNNSRSTNVKLCIPLLNMNVFFSSNQDLLFDVNRPTLLLLERMFVSLQTQVFSICHLTKHWLSCKHINHTHITKIEWCNKTGYCKCNMYWYKPVYFQWSKICMLLCSLLCSVTPKSSKGVFLNISNL